METTAFDYNQRFLGATVPMLIEGMSKKNDAVLQGKSPWNQTVHCPVPAGMDARPLIGKILDVRVDTARTWYLSGSSLGDPR